MRITVGHLAVAVGLLVGYVTPCAAANFFVAPGGSDSRDCSSPDQACATFQRGIALCPVATHCGITAAPGIYSQKTDAVHFRFISISGPMREDGKCVERSAVTVNDHRAPAGGGLFTVEDHATLTLSCMTLTASGNSVSGVFARQFAIADVNDVDFGGFAYGSGVVAAETSKINVVNPSLHGNYSRFAYATDLSQIMIGGDVKIASNVKMEVAFVASVTGSLISFYPTGATGGSGFSGASYQCLNSFLAKTAPLPGGDTPFQATDHCEITGLDANSNLDLSRLRESITAELTAKLESVTAALAVSTDKVAALSISLGKMRIAIDDEQHEQNSQRRLDRAVAVSAAIVLIFVGAMGYFRQTRAPR